MGVKQLPTLTPCLALYVTNVRTLELEEARIRVYVEVLKIIIEVYQFILTMWTLSFQMDEQSDRVSGEDFKPVARTHVNRKGQFNLV